MNVAKIFTHDEARVLGPESSFGLGEAALDAGKRARLLFSPYAAPSAERVIEVGKTVIGPILQGAQQQMQGEAGGGTPLSAIYGTALPVPVVAPGTTIDVGEDVYTPDLDVANEDNAHAFVASSFVVPNVDATVDVTVDDASEFSVSDYDETHADRSAGAFVGGLFWDVTAIAGDVLTLRNRGLPGALFRYGV